MTETNGESKSKKQRTSGGGAHADTTVAFGGCDPDNPVPFSSGVNSMLTDMYQITMCYGYWTANRHENPAVFDMFFRKAPFNGEFTVFCGLSQVVAFLHNYKITQDQLEYLKTLMPTADPRFFEWLGNVDCSKVKVYAFKEGSIVFPREPLLRVEGPIGVCQLLETTLLCLVNYASLVATNAARMRVAVGKSKTLLEMGLRRAQGPDGGISASRYSHMGGFDATSNVAAGHLFGIKVSGTHAHAFVQSFSGLEDLPTRQLKVPDSDEKVDFVGLVLKYRTQMKREGTNMGELTAFIAYCQAFPTAFLALVDTYDTLESGVPNFLACALALIEVGYFPLGIRLDSGDLASLSIAARKMFNETEQTYKTQLPGVVGLGKAAVVASNDIDEERLYELEKNGHEIDTFGIGTHLVTCQAQPALGCVYKLVETNGAPRIKLSQELVKISVPSKKRIFRLFSDQDTPVADIMMSEEEVAANGPPRPGHPVVCRHPMEGSKRCTYTPVRVDDLLLCVWDGKIMRKMESIAEARATCVRDLESLGDAHLRKVDPLPYKVSLSEELFDTMHKLWLAEAPK